MTDEVLLARDVTAEGKKKCLRAVGGWAGGAPGIRGDAELREVVSGKLKTPKGHRTSNPQIRD